MKDWKLEDKIQEVSDYEIRNIGTIHPAVAEKILEVKDFKEFLRKVLEKGFGHNRNIPHGVVAIDDIIKLAGKSLVEKENK